VFSVFADYARIAIHDVHSHVLAFNLDGTFCWLIHPLRPWLFVRSHLETEAVHVTKDTDLSDVVLGRPRRKASCVQYLKSSRARHALTLLPQGRDTNPSRVVLEDRTTEKPQEHQELCSVRRGRVYKFLFRHSPLVLAILHRLAMNRRLVP
jgi:hypothetical protein